MHADVVVVGLGVMGAAATRALTAHGAKVIAIDRFTPPHEFGSSHGRSRVIREAYFEHPLYVPLVRRAYTLWAELERAARTRLFVQTGGLMIGAADGELVAGSLASARAHDVEHELLDAAGIRRRCAGIHPADGTVAVYERRAGLLFPELCHAALLEHARVAGALLRTGTRATGWHARGDRVVVTTDRGPIEASRLVLAVGPWLPELQGELALPLRIERQTLHWYDARVHAERFRAERMPIAVFEYEPDRIVVMYPDTGDGLKVGIHHGGETTTADAVDRTPRAGDERDARALLERFLPDVAWAHRADAVCLYTNTPDHHFIVDTYPGTTRVVIASPCSGHGFKFAPALGELIAALSLDGGTDFDLAPFRIARFDRAAGAG